ncbi:MAG: hypothetical protein ABI728_06085 [Betaproteobacteria bacterium]
MNLKFWEKKPPAEDGEVDVQEEPGDKSASRRSPGGEPRRQEPSRETDQEAAVVNPAHPNRRLIIGAAVAVLISAAIGMASWKILMASPYTSTAKPHTPTSGQPKPLAEKKVKLLGPIEFLELRKSQFKSHQPDNEALKTKNDELRTQIGSLKTELTQAEDLQSISRRAELEALRKKNDELQKEIGVLRENRRQQLSATPASQVAGGAQPPIRGGVMAIGNKNPKATAISLKEAIEAMNATYGNSAGGTVK